MNDLDYVQLGIKIKNLRAEMNLTQAEVAEALNVTPGYISNVEKGRTAMSLRILTYYAKLRGISLDSLVGMIDSDYKESALDREIMEYISTMTVEDKEKLLKTIKIWRE